ncbi:MAG: helix-turn-helix transcriptional regulator [Chloroflexota bacterium]
MKTSDQVQIDFGQRVREFRRRLGLSQEDFAFECGLDRTYVSQVEQGKRNISLRNIKAMADALRVSIAELFPTSSEPSETSAGTDLTYRVRRGFSIACGFTVTDHDILKSSISTARQLQLLPFSLYQSIALKTLSSIVGAVFADCLAHQVGALVNPIEKGHPDIIPVHGHQASEALLRNYPEGLEIKVTVGNVAKGSSLQPGVPRVSRLTGITWQAHHREVKSLLGLVVDFAGAVQDDKLYPIITGIFYADELGVSDWGEISGLTGRNTKVTGMRSSGKGKMGRGWVLVLDKEEYLRQYTGLLGLELE